MITIRYFCNVCLLLDKHGCKPEEASDLVNYVLHECPHLKMLGLMTIGAFDHDLSSGPNPDFQVSTCAVELCKFASTETFCV